MKTDMHRLSALDLPGLKGPESEEGLMEFNERLIRALPAVKAYIDRSLKSAIDHEYIAPGEFTVDAIVDDTYIRAYEEIKEMHYMELFEPWLILKAEEVIQDRLDEKEYNELYVTDMEKFSKAEWEEMDEHYTVDGGGDFVMMEELDDPSYKRNDYDLSDVFALDTEAELIEQLDSQISRDEAARHMVMVLQKMPLAMRTTYELIVRYGRRIEEVARLRKSDPTEVSIQFNEAKRLLRKSFGVRFLSWDQDDSGN